MSLHGVHLDQIAEDAMLAATLRADDMERFRAVPKTVMINQWSQDLEWIIIDGTYPGQIKRRHELLLANRATVIDRLAGRDVAAAETELRDTVVDYVVRTYPEYFRRNDNLIISPLTGLAIEVGPDGADPLVAVALLASEDMLLLLPDDATAGAAPVYRLKSGALLFPNGWSLRSHFTAPVPAAGDRDGLEVWRAARQQSLRAARLGKTPYEIHDGHVAHYMEHFAARVDRFFARMEPSLLTWRRNWGMKLSGGLFLHSDAVPAELPLPTPGNWAKYGYLRSEHETFRKLPATRAVVFGIKTYLWKLSDLVRNPVALEALLMANDQLAPGMVDYRQDYLPTFREFLEQHRSRPPR